jgi:uncharacterized protein (DUF1330 family)
MPKAYVIARVTVTDAAAYADYARLAPEAMRLYGARILARGGLTHALEGDCRPRNVILEFDSMDAALAYWNSAEYQSARTHRLGAAEIELCAVEGVA